MLNQIGSLRPASRMALARTLAAILFWRATAVLSVLKAKGSWHEQPCSAHSNKTMTVAFARIARKHWHAEFCPEAFLQSKVAQLWLGNPHLWSTSASVEADLVKEVKLLKNTLPSFILVGIKSRYKFAGLSHTKHPCLLNGRLSLICLSLALSRILLFLLGRIKQLVLIILKNCRRPISNLGNCQLVWVSSWWTEYICLCLIEGSTSCDPFQSSLRVLRLFK